MNRTQANADAFSKTAPFYDVIYGGRAAENDTRLIVRHLRSPLTQKRQLSLVNLGCGTGMHDLEFWRKGFNVTGVDWSPAMIAEAIKKAKAAKAPIRYVTENILTYAPPARHDAAVSLFDVLSYMTTNKQVEKYFSTVSRLLKPGGVFMFDCWYGPGVLLSQPKIITQTYTSGDLAVMRTKTPVISCESNTVSVQHSLKIMQKNKKTKQIEERHVLRYFFYPEIMCFAEQAGLKITSWGLLDFPLRPAHESSWSVYFIAQKTT